jgi:hypothetical protein
MSRDPISYDPQEPQGTPSRPEHDCQHTPIPRSAATSSSLSEKSITNESPDLLKHHDGSPFQSADYSQVSPFLAL